MLRFVSFSVHNYRSIRSASLDKLSNFTVLIGPNNEGKSNILQALITGLKILRFIARPIGLPRRDRIPARIYDWERDSPVFFQKEETKKSTTFNFEFELTEEEIHEFTKEVRSSLNGTLPVQITTDEKGRVSFRVRKRGKGGNSLSEKRGAIASFINSHLDFEYIPAIRTAEEAKATVSRMSQRALYHLEENEEYKKAKAEVERIRSPFLKEISEQVKNTMAKFLPHVKKVEISIEDSLLENLAIKLIVDDGIPTSIDYKGDGVKSLTALSLMRTGSETMRREGLVILAIEEPESHLHPSAIHKVKQTLVEMAEKYQIILTTHNPIFINRGKIASNIIVDKNEASPAKSIKNIREILGVMASDNLQHANNILLVEGEDDKAVIGKLLSYHSQLLMKELGDATLTIDSLCGASNIVYKLSLLRSALCHVYVILDDDFAGRSSYKGSVEKELLLEKDIFLLKIPGMIEAELEDLYDEAMYSDLLKNDYDVTLASLPNKLKKKKWSERMSYLFHKQGKIWDEDSKGKLKSKMASLACTNIGNAIEKSRFHIVEQFIKNIESRLKVI